ncbi:MAG: hypothetical protein PHO54_02455 [Candidatus Peribacteraceae bacterium]|nr:hypothetical protein [Candidatus Peribacteraceae bacterium]
MNTRRSKSSGVTNAILLQHMQGMKQSLEGRLDHLERDVSDVKKHIRGIDDSLQRLYSHRVGMLGRIERLEETVGIA